MDKSSNESKGMDLDFKEDVLEFKPISEGLGFKDTIKLNLNSPEVYTEIDVNSEPANSDAGTMDVGLPHLPHGEVDLSGDVLRLKTAETLKPVLSHSGHDGLVKKLGKKSSESIFSIGIDVLFSVACSILIFAVLADKLGLTEESLAQPKLLAVKFAIVFGAFYLVYKVFSRLIYGKSLGEWACRKQLGSKKDQEEVYYPMLVLLRELASVATGLFVFPILSGLFRKDIGYFCSGLQIYLENRA